MKPIDKISMLNKKGVKIIEKILLFIIVIATLVAILQEMNVIFRNKNVSLGDLLLLFIYLEIISMAAAYNLSGRVPVRVPVYIAIVAIARVLILDMKSMDQWHILALSFSAFILACTVLIIRWGQIRFPYNGKSKTEDDL